MVQQPWHFGDVRSQADSTAEQEAVFDRAACIYRCCEEYDELDARIRGLDEMLGGRDTVVKACYAECAAGLGDVRDALRELNIVIAHKSLEPWVATPSPLIAYLSSTYVWCGDVVSDLHTLVQDHGGASWEEERRDASESASAYLTEFLAPLFGQLDVVCGGCWLGHPLQRVRQPVEHLESAIVSLSHDLDELPARS